MTAKIVLETNQNTEAKQSLIMAMSPFIDSATKIKDLDKAIVETKKVKSRVESAKKDLIKSKGPDKYQSRVTQDNIIGAVILLRVPFFIVGGNDPCQRFRI